MLLLVAMGHLFVEGAVIAGSANQQIYIAVVSFVSVDVVNYFTGFKPSAKHLFSYFYVLTSPFRFRFACARFHRYIPA